MKTSVDIAIFGGGIAGLWLLNRARRAGYNAILLETEALGSGQSMRSQGIIHGGMKYALQGVLTNDAIAMSDMPALWQQCLQGKGEIDLSRVPVLSPQQYLWAANKFTAKVGGFLAGAALNSHVKTLSPENYPDVFKQPAFKGEVFALDEMVLDVPALIAELAKPHQDVIFKIDTMQPSDFQLDETGKLSSVTVHANGQSLEISAKQCVFTAGEGNELIIKKLQQPTLAMQRRPLHMVLVKTPFNHALYAHCLGLSPRPRITVTTHRMRNGESVWYLGGLLSETGVEKEPSAQIAAAKKELKDLFPWLDFSKADYATFRIDRAEPLQKSGMKPETSFSKTFGNVTVAWPTKLALAPKLAAEIMQQIDQSKVGQEEASLSALQNWPRASVAAPIWETLFCS
jgi:glycerol-3-phosphate dehydrogenase